MSKLIEMQEKRADLAAAMRNLIDSVDTEKGMTADQENQWKDMDAKIANFDKTILAMEKSEKIESAINEFKNVKKPELDRSKDCGRPLASDDYLNAYDSYVRNGLNGFDLKNAMTVGTDSEGGYTVPESWETQLLRVLEDQNIMRSLCQVVRTQSTRNIPLVADDGQAGWVDELGAYPESDIEVDGKVIQAWKLGRILKISEELMDDSSVNMVDEISRSFGITFGSAEEAGFIVGDGNKKPTGVIPTASVGVTAASTTAITYDEIVLLVHSVKQAYRRRSSFLMKDSTVSLLRRLKSADGVPMWQPSLTAGQPDTFMGYRVYSSDPVPAAATGNKAIAFGDFKQYRIADRGGIIMQRLNEKYADTGQIGFRTRKRVDGKLLLDAAVKTLQMA